MKAIVVIIFTLIGSTIQLLSQNSSETKSVYQQNQDKKVIEVEKNHLKGISFAFQKKATSFKIKVPSYPSNSNVGSEFDQTSTNLLTNSLRGDYIVIFDIKDAQNRLVSGPVHIKVI